MGRLGRSEALELLASGGRVLPRPGAASQPGRHRPRAFAGDGAIGEDLGNHIPDATFDLFWPAEDIGELEAACFDAYLTGLREAGWNGGEHDVRLDVVASCVKYTWLLPLMLEQAGNDTQRAYHQPADAQELYRRRGLTFAHLVEWCDEALARIGR